MKFTRILSVSLLTTMLVSAADEKSVKEEKPKVPAAQNIQSGLTAEQRREQFIAGKDGVHGTKHANLLLIRK